MDTVDENQKFRSCLFNAVQKLRVQSADEWAHEPVLAKTLERMRDYLEVLLSSSQELMTEDKRAAREILLDSLQKLDHLEIEAAFDIEAALRASLPELAGDDYTYMCLQQEQQRLARGRVGSDDHIWTDHFPKCELDKLLGNFNRTNRKFENPQAREAAIGRLAELYRQSHHDLRRNRARAAQAGQYLRALCRVLGLLLVAVLALLGGAEAFNRPILAEGRWGELVALGVAMLAGAVGGVLGLMFRFRDANGRIRDLLSDRDVRWVQPLMGGAMALAVVLIVRSELITIGGLTTQSAGPVALAALGFVAGFSEPVFFGVIDRLARVTSPVSTDGRRS
jgi:hypothetical protein